MLLIVFAFTMLPILLLFFLVPGAAHADSQIPMLTYVLAGVALLGGIGAAQVFLRPDRPAVQFQAGMINTLALFELCSLIGIFIGQPPTVVAAAPFVAGSVVGDLVFVLPKVLAFRGG